MNPIYVSISEFKVGKKDSKLITSLGSCIGIAFINYEQQKVALTHSLLPYVPKDELCPNAKYVDCAVKLLVEYFISQMALNDTVAVIIGGGNMTNYSPLKKTVGELNIEATKLTLKKYNIPILKTDVGGDYGRRIEVNCNSGKYEIFNIPRISGKEIAS